jgi:hypothetical protein
MADKLTDEITVKVSQSGKHFVVKRSEQYGFGSAGEYIRHLIDQDKKRASLDLSLLADALGLNVTVENLENQTAKSAGRE